MMAMRRKIRRMRRWKRRKKKWAICLPSSLSLFLTRVILVRAPSLACSLSLLIYLFVCFDLSRTTISWIIIITIIIIIIVSSYFCTLRSQHYNTTLRNAALHDIIIIIIIIFSSSPSTSSSKSFIIKVFNSYLLGVNWVVRNLFRRSQFLLVKITAIFSGYQWNLIGNCKGSKI